ncbi:MAG: aminoglycoside phosphotransferase family protein, partial [Oscillospiraceae bacterium]
MTRYNLKEIVRQFDIIHDVLPYGDGHINDTYVVNTAKRFILQRINSDVFKRPDQVMSNIKLVTEHLRAKILACGGNPERETLTVIPTVDGKDFYKTEDGEYFRMYAFIEGARTYQIVEEPRHFYNAARAFGRFQKLLADFPATDLYETIPDFHNTPKRLENLKKAIKEDKMGRLSSVKAEVDFALAREKDTPLITDAIADGSVPLRVTHNDTKYNNVMIDDETGDAICVIDLDTVMPGSLLYDYGDSLRFGTNPSDEDERDLSLVYSDLNLFEHFTRGYLEELNDTLTDREVELLPMSAKLMTLECGMRFLTDYLEGDTYFKTHRDGQNL